LESTLRPTVPLCLAILAGALALAGSPQAVAHAPGKHAAAEELKRHVLRDGTEILTHGADPSTPALNGSGILDAPQRRPACASSSSEPQVRVVYAALPGTTDPARDLRKIRAAVRRTNGMIRQAGKRYSGDRDRIDIRIACNDAGRIAVTRIGASKSLSFNGLISLLRVPSLVQPNSKFLIFYGDRGVGCGYGQVWPDDRLAANNAHNNVAPMYAAVWRPCWDGTAPLHELTHMLGGVQLTAPNTTSAFHCNDGYDVMCYDDSGASAEQSRNCSALQYDCGHDDFFDPMPRGYLASHWNVASRLNKYLSFR
jgi:hypothetical protein